MPRKARKQFKLKATIYDKRGRVISVGENSYSKSHPLQFQFASEAGRPDAIYLHAEIHALTRLRNWNRAYRIVVERYSNNGEPLSAKPCEICQHALETAGITVVEYTK